MNTTRHPSYLDLDVVVLGGGQESVRAHVETCAQCRDYCEALRRPVPLPNWLHQLEAPRPSWLHRLVGSHWALATACAALVLLVPAAAGLFRSGPASPPAGHFAVTAKGDPAVAIYVLHADHVALWDGHTQIVAGDRLRVKVAPAGRTYVHVASGERGQEQTLFAAPIETQSEVLLPGSWEVAGEGERETIVVGLGDAPLSLEQLRGAPADGTTWIRRYELPRAEPKR